MPISHGTMNLWPLVTLFAQRLRGADRYFASSVTPLLGSATYSDVSTWLFLLFFACILALVAIHRDDFKSRGELLVHVSALSLLALLSLKTRISNHHYILVLPFLILTMRTIRRLAFYFSIAALSVNTLISTWGAYSLVVPGLNLDYFVPSFDPRNSKLSLLFSSLMTADLFISVSSLVNMFVMAWLVWELLRALPGRAAQRTVSAPEGRGKYARTAVAAPRGFTSGDRVILSVFALLLVLVGLAPLVIK